MGILTAKRRKRKRCAGRPAVPIADTIEVVVPSFLARLGQHVLQLHRRPFCRLLSSAASMNANISIVSSARPAALVLKNLAISIAVAS